MIQRKQSLYLLAMILMGSYLIFGNPIMYHLEKQSLQGSTERVDISFSKIEKYTVGSELEPNSVMNSFLLYGLAVIVGLGFGALISFKNRKMQLLLCGFNYLFMSVMALLIYYYIKEGKSLITEPDSSALHYIVFLPIFFPIWNYLAMRGILQDEKLIRSMDRLR